MKDYKITVEIMKLKCPALPVVPPRAVVKSTKTSPSPKRFESESSPSPKRFESKSKEVQVRVKSESKEVRVQVQVRRSKQRKNKIFFKTTYFIIDNCCDTRDGISSILI